MSLIIFIVFVISFWLWHRVKFHNRDTLFKNIPGPKKLPILHNSWCFLGKSAKDMFDWSLEMKEKFGSVYAFTLDAFDNGSVIVSDPKIAEVILKSQTVLEKGVNYNAIKPWLAEGLLLSIGEKWHQRRKILTPAFHFQILERFVEIMSNHGEVLVEKLAEFESKEVDVFPLVNLYTLDVICESAMGCKMDAQNKESDYVKAVKKMADIVFIKYVHPIYRLKFLSEFSDLNKQVKELLETLHGFTDKVIKARKEELVNKSFEESGEVFGAKRRMALLDLLLQTSVNGQPLSDMDIREEVDTFMFEGHDTTTSAISFCLYNIAKYPEVQKKIFEEIQSCIGNENRIANIKTLNDLNYLELVIKESLRLYPSVPFFSRKLNKNLTANGYTFPKNCTVQVSAFLMGRDSNIFENPLEFRPERFDIETTAEKVNPFGYVPFSAGPRNCIGQKFAMYEIKSAVSKIVRNFELSLPKNSEDLQIYMDLVLKSKNGVKLMIKKRLSQKKM